MKDPYVYFITKKTLTGWLQTFVSHQNIIENPPSSHVNIDWLLQDPYKIIQAHQNQQTKAYQPIMNRYRQIIVICRDSYT